MSTFANQGNSQNHPVLPKNGVFSQISWLTLAIGSSVLLAPQIAISQPITPATGANGTGTTITTPDGQQFDINGGIRSGDGANLFHSFEQFGLNQGQTANFISNPEISNILGRVVGGDPSIINGLIQITGGSSNLFLMNPAGIIFGPNASLNIPADFTATTANGIGFGNNQWFNNFGSNDYINLVGTPSAFSFNMSQLGTIINEGNLTLTPGSNLNLFANTVINTGTLATPGGNINITAVPNGNTLRISQPGHILSLEIENRFVGVIRESPLLPELLTGGDPIHHATTVTKQADGTIRLTGSQTPIPLEPGVAVVSGNVDVGGLKPNPALSGAEGYELNILGDKIALIGANIDASGTNGGGNIHIGGNYQGAGPLPNATHTYIDSNTNISANAISGGNGGQIIIWSDNTSQFHGNISATGIENGGFVEVSGKQNLIFRGNADLSATSGNTGTLLLDPENIYIVNGAVAPDDAEIADEQILWDDPFGSPYGTDYTISEQALESLNGNANVELQATNDIVIDDLADNELAFQSGAGVINIAADYDNDGFGSFVMSPGDRITALGRTLYISAVDIITGSIDTGNTGNALLYTSWGSIQPADATTQVTANWAVFQAANGSIGTPNQPLEINANNLEATVGAGGAFFNSPNSGVTLGGITANPLSVAIYGGVFSLTAAGDIIANSGQSISTEGSWPGDIILTSTNGGINISGGGFGAWTTTYLYVDSGQISLTAANDININDIALYSYSLSGDSGDITITSNSGGINLTNNYVYSYSDVGNSGNITIQADGAINIPDSNFIKTYAISGTSGNIDLNSTNGGIDITKIESISDSQDSGSIKLEAAGDINTSSIYSYGVSQGGAIEIISHAGNINTSDGQIESFAQTGNTGNITITSHSGAFNLINGEIDSYAEGGDAGNITIQADGDINTPDPSFISTYSVSGNSGNIDINSTNGSINIGYTGSISEGQNAGSIKVQAAGDINTSNISSDGITQGGDIEIISHTGNINTTNGYIESFAQTGNGGNVTIKADGDINIPAPSLITTYSASGNSGNIDINSTNGSISIGETRSVADGQDGQDSGNIKLEAAGDINVLSIYSYGITKGGDIEIISHTGNINNINGYIESYAETGNTGNITITSHRGEVNLINSQIDVFTDVGNSGNVTIQADGDINLPDPTFINSASTNGKGGDIDINSTNGSINISTIQSFSDNQNAGSVKLEAAGDINMANIFANGDNNGGNIEIISHTGNINASNSSINSLATTGNAGHITITSPNGTFNFINGKIQSFTDAGNAGDVTITTDGDINLPDPTFINSYSINGNGGDIDINSTNGSINISTIQSFSDNQNAGNVKLEAAGDINTSNIYAEGLVNGGDIEIISHTGNINNSNGKIQSFTDTGNGGDVTIKADGDINIPAPAFISAYSIGGNGGDIDINSTSGGINIGNLEAISRTQDGGSVKLEAAGDITTLDISAAALGHGGDIDIISHGGNINTSNGTITSFTGSATAGNIHIQAPGNITTAQISAYAQPIDFNTTTGDGGNITINSTGGTITSTSYLQSYAFYGNAGDVTITAGGDITTNYIASFTYSPNPTHQGGDVNIISDNGGINTTSGDLSFVPKIADTAAIGDIVNTFLNDPANIESYAANGIGADINLQAKNDIITDHLSSYGGASSGDVNITSSDGNINTGVVFSVSPQGNGGNITINAPQGDITSSHINSYATQNGTGGFVDISAGGDFSIGAATINSFSGQNAAGDVSINVGGNIKLGGDANRSAIRSEGPTRGGNISITSTTGEIDASLGRLDSYSLEATAGNVTLNAAENITTAGILSDGKQVGGNIAITSSGGSVDTSRENLESYSLEGTAGNVTIEAPGDIKTEDIFSDGRQIGGNITITSTQGKIEATGGNLYSFSEAGQAGNVTLDAPGDITTLEIYSDGYEVGGNISITSQNGNIDTSGGNLYSFSANGTAGNVTLEAPGNITASEIYSDGVEQGGNIEITTGGTLDLSAATLNSYSANGKAGDVTLDATGNITLGSDANNNTIRSEGLEQGGNISITSTTGEIDASQGIITSYSQEGTAGNVTLNAAENITTAGILSDGKQVGGNIAITSSGGSIDTSRENLESYSLEGTAGNVTIEAPGDITTEDIISDGRQIGGNITITSTQGKIEAAGGNLYSFSEGGQAGNVSLNAPGDIATAEIFSNGYEVGGNIDIATTGGQIDATAGSLNSYSENGTAGNVTLNAPGDIATGNIRSEGLEVGGNIDITTGGNLDLSAATLNSYSENGTAGNVTLSATENITLGGDANNSAIRSEGLQQGGNISITSANGEINTRQGNLDSFSNAGTAGNVFLRANNNINTAAIRSEGAKQGGSIVILSFEGNVDTWGNLNSFSSNGTAGDLAIQAKGNINTYGIRSDGYTQGGLVRLISSNGAINTSWGTLDSYSIAGTAGSVLLEALGSITTGAIRSEGLTQGGSISISSYRDTINTTAGNLQSFSPAGTAGNVSLNAPGKITTASIISYGRSVGGNISINSGSDEGIDTSAGVLETYSTDGNAGNVSLTAPGDIITGGAGYLVGDGSGCLVVGAPCLPPRALGANGEVAPGAEGTFVGGGEFISLGSGIRSQGWLRGGKIEIISNGNINTSLGNLDSYSENGIAGDVTINAGGSFTASNITSYGNFQSGNVVIFSDNGAIRTGTIRTISPNGTSGNVTLNTFSHQGDIITADITSEGGLAAGNIEALAPDGTITTGDLTSRSEEGDAGDITVAAGGDVETGDISSLGGGNSGDITVTSTGGDVTTGDIASIAETGSAGDVTVAAFGDVNTGTITSSGATGDGNISVTSVTGTVNGSDLSVTLEPVQSELAPNQPPVVNQAPANSSVVAITNNNPVASPEMNIPDAPVNLPATDIVTRIVSEGGNVSNINNSVVVRGENNRSSGGDNSGEISLGTSNAEVAKTISVLSSSPLAVATSDAAVAALDKNRESEFEEYFGSNLGQNLTSTASTREAMVKIAEETGYKSAIIYVMAQPEQLELIVMTGTGQPIRKTVPEAPREKLLEVVSQFRSQLTATRLGQRTDGYRKPAQQLYQWLIAPIEAELQAAGINTLLLSMDSGLRSLPMAALYDGQQFLVEKYSMSQIPSISLVDTNYRTLKDTRVLAMGASNFQELAPLPAVPVELTTISEKLWSGVALINENFTRQNLISERKEHPYPIIHLATHGEFQAGAVENSYIQLWGEEKLRLNELRELGWHNPPVELLVLSACRTAVGDVQAEMGFAGLAVQAGVKSALASLWSVSDEGTLALMTEFYRHLENAKIKSEALRQAQIAMIRGELQVSAGELRSSGGTRGALALPPELSEVENSNLSHPYYWSAFTMIGSPW